MTPSRRELVGLAGLAAVLVGVGVLVTTEPARLSPDEPLGLATVAGAAGLAVAAWVLWRVGRDRSSAPPPWTPAGRLADTSPEAAPATPRLAGDALARRTAEAVAEARAARRPEAGIETIRPTLREPLAEILEHGGTDDRAVETTIERGGWTDDQIAAAVISRRVPPPDQPLRERVRTWLHPGVVARERIHRAIDAIEERTAADLAPVPGTDVPRATPTTRRPITDRRRAIDGSLHPTRGGTDDHDHGHSAGPPPGGTDRERNRGSDR